jgi:hypothetical protein
MRFVIVVVAKNGERMAYTEALQRAGVLLEECGRCWTIEVKSKAEAMVWASRCPASDGEMVEIREV